MPVVGEPSELRSALLELSMGIAIVEFAIGTTGWFEEEGKECSGRAEFRRGTILELGLFISQRLNGMESRRSHGRKDTR